MYKKMLLILCCTANSSWSMESLEVDTKEKEATELTTLNINPTLVLGGIKNYLEKLKEIKPAQGAEFNIHGKWMCKNESIGSYHIFITQYKPDHYEISYKPDGEEIYGIYNFQEFKDDEQNFLHELAIDCFKALLKAGQVTL